MPNAIERGDLVLPILQTILGDMFTLAVVGAVIAGIVKLFEATAALNEIKDLLVDIKRNTSDYTPPSRISPPHSPEALLRAVKDDPAALEAALYDTEPISADHLHHAE